MAQAVYYKIFDRYTGELLAEGTARQCADELGITQSAFRSRAERSKNNGQRRSWDVEVSGQVSRDEQNREAIKNWDAFCAPLRKKYGIPIWREAPKEE